MRESLVHPGGRFGHGDLLHQPTVPWALRPTTSSARGVVAVAEGIEAKEQLGLLCALGYELGQADLLAPAVPAQGMPAMRDLAGVIGLAAHPWSDHPMAVLGGHKAVKRRASFSCGLPPP